MLKQAIKKRLSKEENQKGFTLIELLAVIVILGIIAVIAVPLIGNVINNSKKDADVATARQIYEAARLYIIGEKGGDFISKTVKIDGDTATPNDDLVTKGYLDEGIVLPSTKAAITAGTVSFDPQGQLSGLTITAGSDKTFTVAEILSAKPAN
ncbi:prepilin-type N-terminal cleavage/methylation domain-containing protein [Paenibacillus tianjinensis]|uniref:Prepilin-type N-terminal cleavage/methylation domain-containing protein n=1 Tax=Paenibacillus tianjinensis TaxID=2810347 RepID=A0ABX7L952_9BACL|nr:prepilin-type N-terminal cleavage/methylation domain-containing protein [Paenibacillus tianjinensis]QSF44712.1 prepilin-type N-terminal cleavage/methylation domain-containing protein [Paenibacillus tianjinensis]